MLHAFATGVRMGELERVVPVDVNASQRDELVLVAHGGELVLEQRVVFSSRFFFQLNEGEQLYDNNFAQGTP